MSDQPKKPSHQPVVDATTMSRADAMDLLVGPSRSNEYEILRDQIVRENLAREARTDDPKPNPRITNTARQADQDPMAIIAQAAVLGPSRSIEHMERVGQDELSRSSVLPSQCSEPDKRALQAQGVVFHHKVPDDEIFTNVALPEGWTIRPRDHAMHSDLVDERGRARASIFYKAAFYDRRASMNALTRFSIRLDYTEKYDAPVQAGVFDGETRIHTTAVLPCAGYYNKVTGEPATDVERAAGVAVWREAASITAGKQWLVEAGYPDHADPGSYWSKP